MVGGYVIHDSGDTIIGTQTLAMELKFSYRGRHSQTYSHIRFPSTITDGLL
jgi:hypothetical protein